MFDSLYLKECTICIVKVILKTAYTPVDII